MSRESLSIFGATTITNAYTHGALPAKLDISATTWSRLSIEFTIATGTKPIQGTPMTLWFGFSNTNIGTLSTVPDLVTPASFRSFVLDGRASNSINYTTDEVDVNGNFLYCWLTIGDKGTYTGTANTIAATAVQGFGSNAFLAADQTWAGNNTFDNNIAALSFTAGAVVVGSASIQLPNAVAVNGLDGVGSMVNLVYVSSGTGNVNFGGSGVQDLIFNTGAIEGFRVLQAGRILVNGVADDTTSLLQVPGAIASNSLKINSGTPITKVLSATASLNFGSTGPNASSDLTITLTGAALGDCVFLGVPHASTQANSSYSAWVSTANTVTVRFQNNQAAGAIDPAVGTFRVAVMQF